MSGQQCNEDDGVAPHRQPSWPTALPIGGGLSAAHSLPLASSGIGNGDIDEENAAILTASFAAGKGIQRRNMIMLGVYFAVYFSFRSGCLIVLPLLCKKMLQPELGGAEYSPLYQMPLALWFIMDVLLATPNAFFMRRFGRRPGFALGASSAMVASVGAFCSAKYLRPYPWTCFAMLNVCVVFMSLIGMGEFVRYAAAEACTDEAQRSKAITRVLTFGALASTVGPFSTSFVTWLKGGPHDCILCAYPYFFLCTAGFAVIGIAAALSLQLPELNVVSTATRMPLWQILRRPAVSLAMTSQVVVQFVMVVPMSGAPLAIMRTGDVTKGDMRISILIVAHVMAMFLPGFVTGNVIAKVGIFPVLVTGLLLEGSCNVILLCSSGYASFVAALVVLGLGFNCAFTSGTMLLINSHSAEERAQVTSVNETLRFLANACAVLLSSTVQWEVLNWMCLGLVIVIFPVFMLARSAASTKL